MNKTRSQLFINYKKAHVEYSKRYKEWLKGRSTRAWRMYNDLRDEAERKYVKAKNELEEFDKLKTGVRR